MHTLCRMQHPRQQRPCNVYGFQPMTWLAARFMTVHVVDQIWMYFYLTWGAALARVRIRAAVPKFGLL